jgi:hypothetical protein
MLLDIYSSVGDLLIAVIGTIVEKGPQILLERGMFEHGSVLSVVLSQYHTGSYSIHTRPMIIYITGFINMVKPSIDNR